jgi:metal-sulfur cluster biosynthetic enzyme
MSDTVREQTLAAVHELLAHVMDPCAESSGVELSITDMGLVKNVDLDADGDLVVDIQLTSPGCMIGVMKFGYEIETGAVEIKNVNSARVNFINSLEWTEDDITPEGRSRLAAVRSARRAKFGITTS